MKLLIAIDDTDDIGTKGTGEIAEEIAHKLVEAGLGTCSRVTRHQLFVHDDIPYTSHNSSMCFKFNLKDDNLFDKLKDICESHLKQEAALKSDPGLCICRESQISEAVVEFAKSAKVSVKSKAEAYQLAEDHHIFLNEYGGTGDGIIGALSGIGLRNYGFDGRYKGKHKIKTGRYTVDEIIQTLGIDGVMDHDSKKTLMDEAIHLEGKIKSVLWDHKEVLLVYKDHDVYKNAYKEMLRSY